MDVDGELERWQAEWRSHEAIPADLARQVARGTRQMWWGVAGEIAVTVAIGGGSVAWAVVSRRADVAMLAAGVWVIVAIAWTVSFLLRRGAWRPAAMTTAAFVELSILRCERGLQALTAQAILYVLILGFNLTWLYAYGEATSVREFLTQWAVVGIAWIGTTVAAAAAWWYRGRLRRELGRLLQFRRDLEDRTP